MNTRMEFDLASNGLVLSSVADGHAFDPLPQSAEQADPLFSALSWLTSIQDLPAWLINRLLPELPTLAVAQASTGLRVAASKF